MDVVQVPIRREVFEQLKLLAEPLVDDANSVLERLLDHWDATPAAARTAAALPSPSEVVQVPLRRDLFDRLKLLAEPLVDDASSVVERLIHHWGGGAEAPAYPQAAAARPALPPPAAPRNVPVARPSARPEPAARPAPRQEAAAAAQAPRPAPAMPRREAAAAPRRELPPAAPVQAAAPEPAAAAATRPAPLAPQVETMPPPDFSPSTWRTARGERFPVGARLRARYLRHSFEAVITDAGIEFNGETYENPSAAGIAAKVSVGTPVNSASTNGWDFWEILDRRSNSWIPLEALRNKGAA